MLRAHHTDPSIAEQALGTQFRARGIGYHAGFQIDRAVAQCRAVLVDFGQEAQAYARRLFGDAGDQCGTEVFDKTFAATQGESARHPQEVGLLGRA